MTPLLQAQNLGHTFGKSWLFRHIDLELQPETCLVVLGRNGSGKSTLLRCLVGLQAPREGAVTPYARLGFSSLDLALYPQLTAREHLALHARLNPVPDPPDPETLLRKVGLLPAVDQEAGQFSTGMRARLKIALALAADPEILVLDEPTAAIDAEGRTFLDNLVRTFPGALVLATNDPQDRQWATHELELE